MSAAALPAPPAPPAPPASGPTLADIHLPADPSWWPPAPGWWLLLVLLVVVLALLWRTWLPRRRARQRAAAVLREFATIVETFHALADARQLAIALSQFVRRVTLWRDPRAAALSGEPWLRHLDSVGGSDEFQRGVGRHLLDAPYRAQPDFDAAALIALTRRWTRAQLAPRRVARPAAVAPEHPHA